MRSQKVGQVSEEAKAKVKDANGKGTPKKAQESKEDSKNFVAYVRGQQRRRGRAE